MKSQTTGIIISVIICSFIFKHILGSNLRDSMLRHQVRNKETMSQLNDPDCESAQDRR